MKCVKIEDVAQIYEKLLGHNFDVKVNANLDFKSNKIQCCVYPTRRPYKVKDINSEVLDIYIEVYLPITYVAQQNAWLNHINKSINGLQEGEFESNGDKWSYCSTLDFTRPLMAPTVDSGQFMQLVSLQGQMLVSASDGAMVGNDIQYTLSFKENDKQYSGALRVLHKTTAMEKQTETTPLTGEKFAGAFNRTQAMSYTFIILLQKDDFHKRLFSAIEAFEPLEINQIFELSYYVPAYDIKQSKRLILSNGEVTENAGAFTTLTLAFMDASNVLED